MPQLHLADVSARRDADHGCAGICQAGRSGDVFQRAKMPVFSHAEDDVCASFRMITSRVLRP